MKKSMILTSIVLLFFSCSNSSKEEYVTPDPKEVDKMIESYEEEFQKYNSTQVIPANTPEPNNNSIPETYPPEVSIAAPPASKKYFMFTAVNVKYISGIGNRGEDTYSYKVFVSGIMKYNHKPSKDEQYMALDKLGTSYEIKYLHGYEFMSRKAYVFTSYAEASEKRQEILNTGVK